MIDRLKTLYGNATQSKSVSYALIDQTVVSGANFLTGIIVARLIGMEQYGRYTLAWLLILFVNSLQQALVVAPMMTMGPRLEAGQQAPYFGGVLLWQLAFAVASALALHLCATFSTAVVPEWQLAGLGAPLAVMVACFQLQDFYRRYFFVSGRSGLALRNDVVNCLAQLALILIAYRLGYLETANLFWITAVSSLLAVLLGVRALPVGRTDPRQLAGVLAMHWKHARWLLATAITQWLSGNCFLAALGAGQGPAAVGAVRAAQNILGATSVLLLGIENVIPSNAARRMKQGGSDALAAYLNQTGALIVGATLAFCIAVAIRPGSLMGALYGSAYSEHGNLVRYLVPIYLCAALGVVQRAGLRAIDRLSPIFYASLLSSLIALASAPWLVGNYGTSGALAGMIGVQLLAQALLAIALRDALADRERG